jgi:tetratricopeptide (TPR) repeat protein
MNSGLAKNFLSAAVGVVVAFMVVVNPWLGLMAIVGSGIFYYRTVQATFRRRMRTQSRTLGIDDRGMINAATPEIEPASAYLNRGRSLLARQDYVGAIGDFDRVLWAEKDCRVAYYHRAVCLLALDESEQAEIDLDMAADLAQQHLDESLLAQIAQTRTKLIPNSLVSAKPYNGD